ncbi:MFS transporter [Mycoplasmatota bacterium]|nr:MFS transporter [Mycoplasmatota bacterium]
MKNKKIFYAFLLLTIIYISFIALGLPDAILGSAWNLVRKDLNVSLGSLGIMTIAIYIMSIISTYNAPRLLRLLQTKWITFVSILFTGLALMIMSRVGEFYQLLFFAIPLGIGAGAIDVSLNHYLAKNYKASHMNYLHSFYGVGVTLGPTIMASTLKNNSWRSGYLIIGSILIVIALLVLLSFKLWKKETSTEKEHHQHIKLKDALKTKKVINSLIIFLIYVHVESLLGAWIASYIYIEKHTSYAVAALFATTYYSGLTLGRLLSGIFSHKINSIQLVIMGISCMLFASILLIFNYSSLIYYFIIVGLLGIGSGPIFPNMMFINNDQFSKQYLSKVISLQMVVGYMGFGLLTPLAGLIFDQISIGLYPYILLFSTSVLTISIFLYLKHKQKRMISHNQ